MKTLYRYIIGYVLSIVFTAIAFGLNFIHEASGHVFPTHEMILPTLIVLALLQLVVQLFFFLHLGQEKKPRWNLIVLAFAALIVVILVGGTLWIMHNLDSGHVHDVNIFEEENIYPTQ